MRVMMKTKDNGTAPNHLRRGYRVPVNVWETAEELSLEFLIPGYKKDQIEIAVDDGYLHVSASAEKREVKYLRQEYRKHPFEQKFKLPSRIDTESLEASLKNGILSLRIEKIKPKKIDIHIQ